MLAWDAETHVLQYESLPTHDTMFEKGRRETKSFFNTFGHG